LNLLQLQYFQTVARLEHMTKAAQELNVSQPSLSNTMSRLEESLGVPLFVRQGRQIRLTTFGRQFLQRVNLAFFELEKGKREMEEMAGGEKGIISFAVTLPNALPVLLKEFLEIHPQAKLIQNQAFSEKEIISQLKTRLLMSVFLLSLLLVPTLNGFP
jgi:DNA-binding transcriptional LysR family regulator